MISKSMVNKIETFVHTSKDLRKILKINFNGKTRSGMKYGKERDKYPCRKN